MKKTISALNNQVRVKLASMCCEARQDERRKHQLKNVVSHEKEKQ